MDSSLADQYVPTSALPPLGLLSSYSTQQIRSAIQNLHKLYFPSLSPTMLPAKLSVNSTSIRKPIYDAVIDSGYASAEEDDDEFNDAISDGALSEDEAGQSEMLRNDAFERNHAIKWVTGFITHADMWISFLLDSGPEVDSKNEVLDEATSLLSAFTGQDDNAETALTRTFSFSSRTTDDVEHQIMVELNDAPINSDDHTSVGLQSWGSSILFAERICASPSTFLLNSRNDLSKPLRILELGAGTGMLSIITAKLLSTMDISSEIVASDYHPDVLSNLSHNIKTNFTCQTFPSISSPVAVHMLDWESLQYQAPFDEPFDIILAADVIYHPEHAKRIKACVEHFLVRPRGTSNGGLFWLFIPVRTTGRHEGMDETVDTLFPRASGSQEDGSLRLAILDRDNIERRGSVGRADECAYKLSKIGWIKT